MASIKKHGNRYLITVCKGYETVKDENGQAVVDSTGKVKRRKIIETTSFPIDPARTEKQNEKAAREYAYDYERRVNSGLSRGDKQTFREYAEDWMKSHAKTLEKSTQLSYRNILDRMLYPRCADIVLADFLPSEVEKLFQNMRETGYCYGARKGLYSEDTIRGAKICLSSILKSAVVDGIIPKNPCSIRLNQTRRKVSEKAADKCFTPEQAACFLDAITKPIPVKVPAKEHNRGGKIVSVKAYYGRPIVVSLKYQCFFNVALFSGCRRGELVGLLWNDVHFDTNSIYIRQAAARAGGETQYIKGPKTDAGFREIYLPQAVMNMLRELKNQQAEEIMRLGSAWTGDRSQKKGFVFTNDIGGMIDVHTPSKEFKRILRAINANIDDEDQKLPDIHLHHCRHTAATILIKKGVDVKSVSQRMGHKDTATTLRIYAHAFASADKELADVLESAIPIKGSSAV